MKIRFLALGAILAFGLSTALPLSAFAKDKVSFPQGTIACPTWTALLEIMKATKARKTQKVYDLMNKESCIAVSPGAEGTEDYTLDGLLRFYMNDRALWAIANTAMHH